MDSQYGEKISEDELRGMMMEIASARGLEAVFHSNGDYSNLRASRRHQAGLNSYPEQGENIDVMEDMVRKMITKFFEDRNQDSAKKVHYTLKFDDNENGTPYRKVSVHFFFE